ncbi:MAG: hypothetical protein ACTMLY_10400, partial [Microbacterium gubbeenense]
MPLVMQLGQRHGDTFSTEYAQRSLERWRILRDQCGHIRVESGRILYLSARTEAEPCVGQYH